MWNSKQTNNIFQGSEIIYCPLTEEGKMDSCVYLSFFNNFLPHNCPSQVIWSQILCSILQPYFPTEKMQWDIFEVRFPLMRKHFEMNHQISKRDRIKQITALVLRKFNLNGEKSEQSLNSFSELEALVYCCEELPLSSLAYLKRQHKGACRSFFCRYDCWGGEVWCCWHTGWDFFFHPWTTPLWTERDETDAAYLKRL